MSQLPTVLVPGHHPRARAFVEALESRGFTVALVEGDLPTALPRAAAYVAMVDSGFDGPVFSRTVMEPARAAACRVFAVLDSLDATTRDRLLIAGAADVSPEGDPEDLAGRIEAALLGWMRTGPRRRLKAAFKAQRGRQTFDLPVSDIDPGGLTLVSGNGVRKGELLRLALPLPNGALLVWGRVAEDQGRPAIRFLGLSIQERRRIASAVQARKPSAPQSPSAPSTSPSTPATSTPAGGSASPTPVSPGRPAPVESSPSPSAPLIPPSPPLSPTPGTISQPRQEGTPLPLPGPTSDPTPGPISGLTSGPVARQTEPPSSTPERPALGVEAAIVAPSDHPPPVVHAASLQDEGAAAVETANVAKPVADLVEATPFSVDLSDFEETIPPDDGIGSAEPALDGGGVTAAWPEESRADVSGPPPLDFGAEGEFGSESESEFKPIAEPGTESQGGVEADAGIEEEARGGSSHFAPGATGATVDSDSEGASVDSGNASRAMGVDSIADAIGELLADSDEPEEDGVQQDGFEDSATESDDPEGEAEESGEEEELPLQRWPEQIPQADDVDGELRLAASHGLVSEESGELGQTILEFASSLTPMERRAWDEDVPEELLAPELLQRQLNLRLRLHLLTLEGRSLPLPPEARWEIDEELLRPLKAEANALLDEVQALADEFLATGEATRIRELNSLRAPISRALGELESVTDRLLGVDADPLLGRLPLDHEERAPDEEDEAPVRRRAPGKKKKAKVEKKPSPAWRQRDPRAALVRRLAMWLLVLIGLVVVLVVIQPERARRVPTEVAGNVAGVIEVIMIDDKATVRMAPAWQVDPAAIEKIRENLVRAGVKSAVVVDFDGRMIAVGNTRSALRLAN